MGRRCVKWWKSDGGIGCVTSAEDGGGMGKNDTGVIGLMRRERESRGRIGVTRKLKKKYERERDGEKT